MIKHITSKTCNIQKFLAKPVLEDTSRVPRVSISQFQEPGCLCFKKYPYGCPSAGDSDLQGFCSQVSPFPQPLGVPDLGEKNPEKSWGYLFLFIEGHQWGVMDWFAVCRKIRKKRKFFGLDQFWKQHWKSLIIFRKQSGEFATWWTWRISNFLAKTASKQTISASSAMVFVALPGDALFTVYACQALQTLAKVDPEEDGVLDYPPRKSRWHLKIGLQSPQRRCIFQPSNFQCFVRLGGLVAIEKCELFFFNLFHDFFWIGEPPILRIWSRI